MHTVFSRNRFVPLSLLLAFTALYAVFAGGMPVFADAPAQDAATAKFESDFMQTMIDHHTMAEEMSKVCLQKAKHEELRGMCQNIIDSQTKEIQLMQSWLQRWYQITKEPMMMAQDEQMLSHLNAAGGDEFDTMFMQMMIEHHNTAIQEATPCVERAAHQELGNLCQTIISSQQQEIEQMKTWLAQWYNLTANVTQATPSATVVTTTTPQATTTTPEANATATPDANATLPQTGAGFETNSLLWVAALVLIALGAVLFARRWKSF